ncbi:hypothetical protein NHB34_01840 [Polynucleobacter sp. MWH-UH19D]|uniref:hypothetical protein n=1 Tax=Polynucleobacter sp. MWH-UH19D TaxID=1855610 RepID=UPI003365229F
MNANKAVNHQGQTGPKTQLGKQASAKNSRKSGIFVKGYLEWEDIEQKQQIHEALCEQWGAHDPTSQLFITTFEQASLECERIMYAQKLKIDATMMQLDIAKEFARLANLDDHHAYLLPSWYFMEDDEEKLWSIFLHQVWLQAKDLQRNFRDSLIPKIPQDYPQLYEYIMDGQAANASFVQVLGSRFLQSVPTLNLAKLMNEISEKYPHHLQWAQDPRRYQVIVDGLRANLLLEALDLEKSSRYMTSIQNRMLKAVQALTALKQMRADSHNPVIELGGPAVKLGHSNRRRKDLDEGDEAVAA